MKKLMKSIVENSVPTMKTQLLKLGHSRITGKIDNSSWNRIPAVSKVIINVNEHNTILKALGIEVRQKPDIKFTPEKSNRMNRYMGHQIKRIYKAKAKKQNKLMWVIIRACMKNSISFRISAINHVIPSWWYSWSVDSMKMLNRQVTKIVGTQKPNLKFRRVYIEKANGKYRPLGVPSPAWRIALHMLNNMLQIAFAHHLLENQHGYIPGRGTLSAWRAILTHTVKHKYIYETDLKNFFGEVLLDDVDQFLRYSGMPRDLRNWIYDLNRQYPELPKTRKLPEKDPYDLASRYRLDPLLAMLNAQRYREAPKGLAQGAPTSPFLSILTLKPYLTQQFSVNYADDQLFSGDEPFEIIDAPEHGLIHATEKCGWVRYDGKWLKELKFLGMIYNPEDHTLRSETRSGRVERIGQNLVDFWQDFTYSKTDTYLEDLAQRNFFGFVQAALFSGDWTYNHEKKLNEKSEGEFKRILSANHNSWFQRYEKSRTLSSTAIMALGKIIKKSM